MTLPVGNDLQQASAGSGALLISLLAAAQKVPEFQNGLSTPSEGKGTAENFRVRWMEAVEKDSEGVTPEETNTARDAMPGPANNATGIKPGDACVRSEVAPGKRQIASIVAATADMTVSQNPPPAQSTVGGFSRTHGRQMGAAKREEMVRQTARPAAKEGADAAASISFLQVSENATSFIPLVRFREQIGDSQSISNSVHSSAQGSLAFASAHGAHTSAEAKAADPFAHGAEVSTTDIDGSAAFKSTATEKLEGEDGGSAKTGAAPSSRLTEALPEIDLRRSGPVGLAPVVGEESASNLVSQPLSGQAGNAPHVPPELPGVRKAQGDGDHTGRRTITPADRAVTEGLATTRVQTEMGAGDAAAAVSSVEKRAGAGEGDQNPFMALDASSAGHLTWTHAAPRLAEAGFADPALGWVSVRADLHGGSVHAAVLASSTDSAAVLGGELAGLGAHLADRHIPVASLGIATASESYTSSHQNAQQGGEETGRRDSEPGTSANLQAPGPHLGSRPDASTAVPAEVLAPYASGAGTHISIRV